MPKLNVSNFKIWPHLTVVAIVCAIAAGVAVGWWVRHEQKVSAKESLNAARIQRVDGEVALNNGVNSGLSDANWVPATANQPFTVGDRIYTRENSHASLAFTGRNFAQMRPNTSLDVLALTDQNTQLALRDGSAIFDVGYLAPNQLFEVATPYGAVDLQQPGLYDVGIDNGAVIVSVLNGLAQVVGLGGRGQIGKGEVLRLLGQTAADVALSQIDGGNAGYLLNDYYSYQYPQYYDGRYRDYNVYLSDPYYFDPYRRTTSYQYVNSYIPGIYDLDYYGQWQNLNGYGYAWQPRVDVGWSPYTDGYWLTDYPYGPTWVSSEPWGYAPYHYGRWAYVGNHWYWIPDRVSNPVYSPALVAFIPFAQNQIGWVPLGPGDPYAPRYYYDNWQPYYLSGTDVIQSRLVNLYVPDAVTVVPLDDFHNSFDWRHARRADRQMLASVNPTLDPLTLTPLRNAVIHSAWGRGKIDVPPGIARKLQETTVVTSVAPPNPPFRRDISRTMHVKTADRSGNRQFKVKDEREVRGGRPGPSSRGEPNFPNAGPGNKKRGSEAGNAQGHRNENRGRNAKANRAVRSEQQPQGQRVGQPAREPARRESIQPKAKSRSRTGGSPNVRPGRSQQARPSDKPGAHGRARPGQRPSSSPPATKVKPDGNQAGGRGQANQNQPSRGSPQNRGGGKGKGRKP